MTSQLQNRAEQIITELEFETSRSSGKGGQHVNKTESRVTVIFQVSSSSAFNESEKQRLSLKLGSRLQGGVFRLSCQKTRSQHRNKEMAIQWLLEALEKALFVPKARKKKKISKAQKEARLKRKKLQGEKKKLRKRPSDD